MAGPRQLARADRLARHGRALFDRGGKAGTDHGDGPAHSVEHRPLRARHHRRVRDGDRIDGAADGSAPLPDVPGSRPHPARSDRAADARRRQRHQAAAAADSSDGALPGPGRGRARGSVDCAHGADARRRRDRHGRRPQRRRGHHGAGRRRGLPVVRPRHGFARLVGDPSAAPGPPARGHRHAAAGAGPPGSRDRAAVLFQRAAEVQSAADARGAAGACAFPHGARRLAAAAVCALRAVLPRREEFSRPGRRRVAARGARHRRVRCADGRLRRVQAHARHARQPGPPARGVVRRPVGPRHSGPLAGGVRGRVHATAARAALAARPRHHRVAAADAARARRARLSARRPADSGCPGAQRAGARRHGLLRRDPRADPDRHESVRDRQGRVCSSAKRSAMR